MPVKSTLYVVGLGPAGLQSMTIGDYQLLNKANRIFFRTINHPCAQDLIKEGIQGESFDTLYNQEGSFEAVYEGIVSRLEHELEISPMVVYAVPGHPMVAERSVRLIVDKLSSRFDIQVRPALSFLDPLFAAVQFDPVEGFLLRNYDGLKGGRITGQDWLIIPQVYSSFIASEVKLDLMEVYPDEALMYIVQALGTEQQNVTKCLLYELDHQKFDHLTTVIAPPHLEGVSMAKLLEIMGKLRSPGGCPWDQEQTHESLKPYLIEESYEVLEAIEKKDMYNLSEELGDLLLQVIFHAQVAQESGDFGFQDVLRGIIQKMIRRHPHVFGDVQVNNSIEVLRNWDQIKAEEKGEQEREKDLFDFPSGLPALMLAMKTQKKVAKVGFDWPDLQGPFAKVYEELKELEEAISEGKGIQEEFGDTLFALVNVSRFLKLDSEDSLRITVQKFQNRFRKMSELAIDDGKKLVDLSLEQMDKYWEIAKIEEKNGENSTNS
jgi:tetrapyrrole methylase family protein / MazG family protein